MLLLTTGRMQNKLYVLIELLWWAITAIVVIVVQYPIWNAGIDWVFQVSNTMFIVTLITLARHIFTLHYSLIGQLQIVKAVIMVAMIPFTFFLISDLNAFQTYIGEQLWDKLTGHLPYASRRPMESYMWNEMLFFAAGSIIAAPALSVRLFISIWRQYNAEKHKVYQTRG